MNQPPISVGLGRWQVSNVDSYGEGWEFVDLMADVCQAGHPLTWQGEANLPTFLHACQHYTFKSSSKQDGVTSYTFGKRKVCRESCGLHVN